MLFEIDTLLLVGVVLLSVLALVVAVRPVVYRRVRSGRNQSTVAKKP
jgi:hypothetical protein